MFGTDVAGVYFLTIVIIEIAASAACTGYDDAVVVFGSQYADDRESNPTHHRAFYSVLANGFCISLALSLVVAGAFFAGMESVQSVLFSDRPELTNAVKIAAISLPLMAFSQIGIAATRSIFLMEYEAVINGFAKPCILLAASAGAYALGEGFLGLMWAHVITHAVVAAMTLWAFERHFSLKAVLRASRRLTIDRPMLRFAVPQNLNMTFISYLSRIDLIMLGAFGISNHLLAFYGVAAIAIGQLRQVRLVFSTVLGAIVSREKARGNIASIEDTIGRVSRWIVTIIAPIILVSLVLRNDILQAIDPAFLGATGFVAVLLIPAFINCAYGLAGNCIVFTRHSGWNLFNSLVVGGLNTLLNFLLIPLWGLLGAAVATAISGAVVGLMQVLELWHLEHVAFRWNAIRAPHVGLFICLVPVGLMWDLAGIGDFGTRVAVSIGLVLVFGLTQLVLNNPEVRQLLARVGGATPH